MAKPGYALMKGGRIYTLKPTAPDPLTRGKPRFAWQGYCDGVPCGFFKTKADFEAFVDREPEYLGLIGPHASAVSRAETWSTYEGHQILQALVNQRRIP